MKENEREHLAFQDLLTDREAMIAKLRSQIQSLLKQDSERASTITSLRSEICELNEKVAQWSSEVAQVFFNDHTNERERALLETKLRNSQGTDDLIRKKQCLTEIIGQLNALYVELKQEYVDLRRRSGELSNTTRVVFDYAPRHRHCSIAKDDPAQHVYLRRVLLQFFWEEQRNRASLIPVVLALVGCDPTQICAAIRHWERGSQLFSRLFGS
jgi:hypothetical protein